MMDGVAPPDVAPQRAMPRDLAVVPDTSFHRLTEREFGMPGLVAIESVGPFVEIARLGPFVTIHDSFLDPGLGIGHHPHRSHERLFYILRGEIRHDDSLNGIRGVMEEGDLARLTEGQRGMLHREWNGRDDIRTHAFILVYRPDVVPPIPFASFDALRARDVPRISEGPGVQTLQLLGGASTFHANASALTSFLDTTLSPGATLEHRIGPAEGVIAYPLAGTLSVDAGEHRVLVHGRSQVHPEGPGSMAIAWSDERESTVLVAAADEPARIIRLGFERRDNDVVLQAPLPRD
jgi:redox-sensitive bicupin YhaK (pirin superfamily)